VKKENRVKRLFMYEASCWSHDAEFQDLSVPRTAALNKPPSLFITLHRFSINETKIRWTNRGNGKIDKAETKKGGRLRRRNKIREEEKSSCIRAETA
jgi:hypothetical protein